MSYYKNDFSFQSVCSHVNFYIKFTEDNEKIPDNKGLKTPDILINDDDWDERFDNEA